MYSATAEQAKKIYDLLGVPVEQRYDGDVFVDINSDSNDFDDEWYVDEVLASHGKEQQMFSSTEVMQKLREKIDAHYAK
ncbi:MAG: hypothetical protein LBU60_05125 [Clostridiales bacterium]|jgi:hypothetical protein|nr:hypothetical protein [Clostridiales bacterium]